jgi:fructose-1,6-bisphosphatase I
MPERSKYFSVNEGNYNFWNNEVRSFVDYLKENDRETGRPYNGRYIGSLVADFHRNLIAGGIFLYPRDHRNPAKPHGKLRLLYEAAPLAFLVEQAGGRAITDEGENIMDIQPQSLHERVPLVIGSRHELDLFEEFVTGRK